jgi:hypothetical protein
LGRIYTKILIYCRALQKIYPAYVVKGEILDNLDGLLSKSVFGNVVYLPAQYSINTPFKSWNFYNSIRNHGMGAVISALNQYEGR